MKVIKQMAGILWPGKHRVYRRKRYDPERVIRSFLELLLGQMAAIGAGIDQRAGGPRRVVKQRLVPEAGRVMRIERHLRRGDRRKAVIVVERVKAL